MLILEAESKLKVGMKSEIHTTSGKTLTDPQEFKAFFYDLFPVMVLFAKKYIPDEDDATDIVQESFLTLWEKKEEIKNEEGVRYYLYTLVRNKCLNFIKHQKAKDNYVFHEKEEVDFFEATYMEQEVFLMLREFIDALPSQTKNIMNLSLQGLSNKDIADRLNKSENTIKTLKKRAYKKLNENLKEHFYLFFL